jgi:hypothetical protein
MPINKVVKSLKRCVSIFMIVGFSVACKYPTQSAYINERAAVSLPGLPFALDTAVFLNQYSNPFSRITSWILADSGFAANESIDRILRTRTNRKLCILHWVQTDDPVWIGARIPGTFLGADLLMYERNELVIKRYKPGEKVADASAEYKKELQVLLSDVVPVIYP